MWDLENIKLNVRFREQNVRKNDLMWGMKNNIVCLPDNFIFYNLEITGWLSIYLSGLLGTGTKFNFSTFKKKKFNEKLKKNLLVKNKDKRCTLEYLADYLWINRNLDGHTNMFAWNTYLVLFNSYLISFCWFIYN